MITADINWLEKQRSMSMGSKIEVWRVNNKKLERYETTLSAEGRKEYDDLEQWIKRQPEVLSPDILIIGEQVSTQGGPLDLLAIDHDGTLIIIELKRGQLPRQALTQAIDYASDIASWDIEKLNEVCFNFCKMSLEEAMTNKFQDINLDDITINNEQNILLVGLDLDESLERMMNWLSDKYDFGLNYVLFKYIKAGNGDEFLARYMVIQEGIEKQRVTRKKFNRGTSDEPGNYEDIELKKRLREYLGKDNFVPKVLKEIVFPMALAQDKVSRDQIIEGIENRGEAEDKNVGFEMTVVSNALGHVKKDFLRQVIGYERNKDSPWMKDNFYIRKGYKDLIRSILDEIKQDKE